MKKYKNLMIMAFLGMLSLSCVRSNRSEDIHNFSDNSEGPKENPKNLVAELPSIVNNTDYIVFSIRNNQIEERKRSSYDSEDWYNNYLDNLIFQHIKTEETYILTTKKIKIISYQQLKDSINTTLNTTIYEVIDSFPKSDKHSTFTALYMSTNEGKNFTKITKENEHLSSWNYIPETANIYFITNDDIDNNRKLDIKDSQSIHSVSINDFKRKGLLVQELKLISF